MNSHKHDLGLIIASSLTLPNTLGIKFQRFFASLSVGELKQIEERLCVPLAEQLGIIGGIFDKYIEFRKVQEKQHVSDPVSVKSYCRT